MYIKYNYRLIVIAYILAIIIFLISATAITLYSMGYQLNLKTFVLEKTGIIRLNPIQKDFSISINNKLIEQSEIESTTEIANLKPDNYEIKINAPEYIEWKKTVPVLPNQISNVYDVVLIPQQIKTEEITYLNQYSLNNKYRLLAYTTNDKLQIFNFQTQKIQTAANIKINNSSQINWINDELLAITNSNPEETVIQILNPFNNNISSHTIKQSINSTDIIGTIPYNESTLIYYFNNSLYTVDITSKLDPQTIVEHVFHPATKDGSLYYLPSEKNAQQLYIQNLTLKTTTIIDLPSKTNDFQLIPDSNYIQIKSDQTYTIINSNDQKDRFSLENNYTFYPSPNLKYLAGFNQQEIVSVKIDQKFQTNTILRLTSNIDDIIWIDSTNLIYASQNQLARIDINGDNHNIIEKNNNTNYQLIFGNQQKLLVISTTDNQKLLKIISFIN